MNNQDIEQAIQAKGLTAPRVTPADIKALMDRIVYTFDVRPNGSTTTLAHAFLDGSFYLATGVSACVSVENFDAELGKDIAMKGAKAAAEDRLWELEGYALWKRLAAAPKTGDRDALLRLMVGRFLCWDLPDDFAPDCHVSFDRDLAKQGRHSWPSGTNLLTADQALAMFRHCLQDLSVPSSAPAAVTDSLLKGAMGWIEILELMLDAEPDSIAVTVRNSETGEEAEVKLSDFKAKVAAATGVVVEVEEVGDEEVSE